MIPSVAAALHDGLRCIPRQELQPVHRLHILVVTLLQDLFLQLTCLGIVCHQSHVVLVAIQFKDVEQFAVGRPGEVGMVVVGFSYQFHPSGFLRLHVVDAHFHLVTGLTGHRVFVHCDSSNALRDIHLGISGHHALVHAVEGQLLSVGTPEGALRYAELVAMHALSVDDVGGSVRTAVLAHLQGLAFSRPDIQISLYGISQMFRLQAEVLISGTFRYVLAPQHASLLPVYLHAFLARAHLRYRFLIVRQQHVVSACGHLLTGNLIQAFHSEKYLARQQFLHLVGRCLHRRIAPPLCVSVLGLQVVPVRAARHHIFQRQQEPPFRGGGFCLSHHCIN